MTASTPRRLASACQSSTASAPACRTARRASRSSSEPGKVTTPIRAVMSVLACGGTWSQATWSAGVPEFRAGPERERRVVPPRDSLLERHYGALTGTALHGHVVNAGLHDRESAPRLRQVGDHTFPGEPPGPGDPAAQGGRRPGCGRRRRGPPATQAGHPRHRPDSRVKTGTHAPAPGRVDAAAVVQHLHQAPPAVHVRDELVAAAGTRM